MVRYQAFCTRYGHHWSLMAVFIPWCIGMVVIDYNFALGLSLVLGGVSVSAVTTAVDLGVPKLLRARRIGLQRGSAIYQRVQCASAAVATFVYLSAAATSFH
jgi:hypothetical protein